MSQREAELHRAIAEQQAIADDRAAQYTGDYATGRPGLGEIDRSMGKGEDLLANVGRGAVGVLGSSLSGAGQELAAFDDTAIEDSYLNQAGEYIKGLSDKIDINPEYAEDITTKIARGGGSMLGFMGGTIAGGVAGTVAGGPGVGTAAGLVTGATMGATAMMDEMVQDYKRTTGKMPTGEDLDKLSEMSALGISEVAPIGRAFKIAKGIDKAGYLKGALGHGLEQGVEEAIQEGSLKVAKNYAAKEVVKYDKDRALYEGLVEDTGIGGATGFIMGAAMGALGVKMRGSQVSAESGVPTDPDEQQRMEDDLTKVREDAISEGETGVSDARRLRKEIKAKRKEKARAKKAENISTEEKTIIDEELQDLETELSQYTVDETTEDLYKGPTGFERAQARTAAKEARDPKYDRTEGASIQKESPVFDNTQDPKVNYDIWHRGRTEKATPEEATQGVENLQRSGIKLEEGTKEELVEHLSKDKKKGKKTSKVARDVETATGILAEYSGEDIAEAFGSGLTSLEEDFTSEQTSDFTDDISIGEVKEKKTDLKKVATKNKVRKMTKSLETLASKGNLGSDADVLINKIAKEQAKYSKRNFNEIKRSVKAYAQSIYANSAVAKEKAAGKKGAVALASKNIKDRKSQQRVDAAAGTDVAGMETFMADTLDSINLEDKAAFTTWNRKPVKRGGTTLKQLKAYAAALGITFKKEPRNKATVIQALQNKKRKASIPPKEKVIKAANLADAIAEGRGNEQFETALGKLKQELVDILLAKGKNPAKVEAYVNKQIAKKMKSADPETAAAKTAAIKEDFAAKGISVEGNLSGQQPVPLNEKGNVTLTDLPLVPEAVQARLEWLDTVMPRYANGRLNKKYTYAVHTIPIKDVRNVSTAMAQYGVKAWASKVVEENGQLVLKMKITNNTRMGTKQIHPMGKVKGLEIPAFSITHEAINAAIEKASKKQGFVPQETTDQAVEQEAAIAASREEGLTLGEDFSGQGQEAFTDPDLSIGKEEEEAPPNPFLSEGAAPRTESGEADIEETKRDSKKSLDDFLEEIGELDRSRDGNPLFSLGDVSKEDTDVKLTEQKATALRFQLSKIIAHNKGKFKEKGIDLNIIWSEEELAQYPSVLKEIDRIHASIVESAGLEAADKAIKDTKGFLVGDEVVIIGQNIKSLKSLDRTVLHEVVGHYSIERFLGDKKFGALLHDVMKSKHFRKRIEEIKGDYATQDKTLIAREIIAHEANNMDIKKPTPIMKRIARWFRHVLRSFGLNNLTQEDILIYLKDANIALEEGGLKHPRYKSEQAVLSLGDAVRNSIRAAVPHSLNLQEDVIGLMDRVSKMPKDLMDQIQGPWAQRNIQYWNRIAKPFAWYSPLKALAQERAFRAVRGQTLGTKSTFDEYSREVYETYKNLSGDQKELVMDFYSNAGRKITDKKYESIPEDVKETMQISKNTIRQLGKDLVSRGILSKEVQEKNDDAYIPRQFIMWMMEDPKVIAQFGSGNRLSAMNYIKQKNLDMTPAQLEYLGNVKDPAILVAQTIATVGRDIALHDMLTGINEMKVQQGEDPWIFPGSQLKEAIPIPWNKNKKGEVQMGQIAHELEYLADAKKIFKKHTKYDSAANQEVRAEREAYLRNELKKLNPAWENLNISKYKYVEESKRNGAISGKWLRKEIYNDIKSTSFAFSPENQSKIEKVAEAISNSTRWWKSAKTVWNPPTHVRNAVGNFVNLDISTDTSSTQLTKMVYEEMGNYFQARVEGKSFEEMDSPWWQIADQMGITESTFTAQEAKQALSEWQKLQKSGNWMDGVPNKAMKEWLQDNMPHMTTGFMKGLDKMAGAYQLSESLFKVVKLRDNIQRYEAKFGKLDTSTPEGKANAQAVYAMAVDNAQTWIFDYSNVHQAVRFMRSAPIGAPFISFAYLALPRMMESFAKHPQKFIKYAMLPYAVGTIAAMSGALGEDEDDWDEFKAKMPTYMNTKWGTTPFGIPLPGLNYGMHDDEGNVRVADIGYFIPWTPFIDAFRAYQRKLFTKQDSTESWVDPILNIGLLNGPLPDLVTTLRTGIDPFTQRPVMDRYGTVPEQIGDVTSYIFRTAMPTFLTEHGVRGKLWQVVAGDNINPRTGEKKLDGFEAALRGIGVNTVSPDTRNSIQSNYDYRRSIINKQKAHDRKEIMTLRANGGSLQDLAKMRKDQQARMKVHKDTFSKYKQQVRGQSSATR